MNAPVLVACVVMVLIASNSAYAVEDAAVAVQACRNQNDGAARLACYDAILIPPVHGFNSMTKARTLASAVVADSAANSATQQVGLSSRPVSVQDTQAIESALIGLFEGWQSGSRLRLANGQVWQVTDGSAGVYALVDAKIRISRGLFGSHFMKIEGVAQTPRVRRVE